MLRVDNYSRLPSLTSAYSDDPEGHDADVTRPVLLPPGATRPILATPLSEESQLKRQAYTGYFIQHLVRFTMSSVSFGLSLAAAVLSGGAGIPLAVVTGTAMIIAAGDACCALYNLIQVRNDREPLKTGNDSIVLATKTLMTTCGMSDSHAETVGDVASCAFRIGIALSSIFFPPRICREAPPIRFPVFRRVSRRCSPSQAVGLTCTPHGLSACRAVLPHQPLLRPPWSRPTKRALLSVRKSSREWLIQWLPAMSAIGHSGTHPWSARHGRYWSHWSWSGGQCRSAADGARDGRGVDGSGFTRTAA